MLKFRMSTIIHYKSRIDQEIKHSTKILHIARAIDGFTSLFGISFSIPSLGSSILISELIESAPEISYMLWRRYHHRKFLRTLVLEQRELAGKNNPVEIEISNYLKKYLLEDIFTQKILSVFHLDSELANYLKDNKSSIDQVKERTFLHIFLALMKGSWKEILDLIPIVNRVSMEEKNYLKLLKKLKPMFS